MLYREIGSVSLMAFTLASCVRGGSPTTAARLPPLLPVSQVVNAVKCELARTFVERPQLLQIIAPDPNHADVKGSLELKNAVVRTVSGNAGGAIPVLGIEVDPSASFSRAGTTGRLFNVDFSYDLSETTEVPKFCDSLAVKVEGSPFIYMLEGIHSQYGQLGAGAPKVKLGAIAYTSSFVVEEEATGGFTIKFLIFSLGSKVARKTTDSQTLKMVFGLSLPPTIQ
jgi:hypothetical protein